MSSVFKLRCPSNKSKHFFSVSMACFLLLVAGLSRADETSTCFVYPVGSGFSSGCGTWLSRDENNGGCYFLGEYHIGTDMLRPLGTPVYAIAAGTVVGVSTGGWGNTGGVTNVALLIRHTLADGSQFVAVYGHIQSSLNVNSVTSQISCKKKDGVLFL